MKNLYKIEDELYIISDKEKSSYCIKEYPMAGLNIDRCDCPILGGCSNKVGNIILTTNDLLIKDGVQAIDDEFLEWFVKNPSCEGVEVKLENYYASGALQPNLWQHKIIPKEEPNQETVEEDLLDTAIQVVGSNNVTTIREFLIKHKWQQERMCTKQETLEEAAEKYAKQFDYAEDSSPQLDFIEGAKWQSERMYSEQEAYAIWKAGKEYWRTSGASITFEELLEQFKKK